MKLGDIVWHQLNERQKISMRILPFHMLALELIYFYSSIKLVELTYGTEESSWKFCVFHSLDVIRYRLVLSNRITQNTFFLIQCCNIEITHFLSLLLKLGTHVCSVRWRYLQCLFWCFLWLVTVFGNLSLVFHMTGD